MRMDEYKIPNTSILHWSKIQCITGTPRQWVNKTEKNTLKSPSNPQIH